MLAGAIVSWLGNAVYFAGLSPFPGLDLTPFAFTVSGMLVAWGIFRHQFLNIMPVVYDWLFFSMGDSVIILNAQVRIVDVNPAAPRLLQDYLQRAQTKGKDLEQGKRRFFLIP